MLRHTNQTEKSQLIATTQLKILTFKEYSYSYSVDIFNWVVAIHCNFSVLNVLQTEYSEIQDNYEKICWKLKQHI